MKEDCVCLTLKKREKGLTAQQRVAGGEMWPIFSHEPKLLFKDKVLGVGLVRRRGAATAEKSVLISQLTLFPGGMLSCHIERPVSGLCLVSFSLITRFGAFQLSL